jgi:hypothetical protein
VPPVYGPATGLQAARKLYSVELLTRLKKYIPMQPKYLLNTHFSLSVFIWKTAQVIRLLFLRSLFKLAVTSCN